VCGPTAYDGHCGQEQEDIVDLHSHGHRLRTEVCLREGMLWNLIIEEAKWIDCDDNVGVDAATSSKLIPLAMLQFDHRTILGSLLQCSRLKDAKQNERPC
jgi:hypothetical protein